jgi:hypothetical protein
MMGLLLGAAPAWGADKVEHWTAADTTASSITGDVFFSPDKIIFQNGKSLSLALVGQVAGFTIDSGVSKVATIYRVIRPADPVLLNTNRFCPGRSHTPVTYIAVWIPGKVLPDDYDPRALDLFTGKQPPRFDNDPSYCAGFGYEANFQENRDRLGN